MGADGSATDAVGGAGAASAAVQRVTLASDDPAVTALQIIDDWDESDRAKVNLIVGQAGVAAGAGVVGATVPRVTLASDDPAVTSLQLIDNAMAAATPIRTRPGMPTTQGLTNAAIDIASSGDNTIVSATASQTTRVFRLALIVDAAVDIIVKTGSTALTGTLRFKSPGASLILDFDGEPHFITGSNEAFILNLSAAISVDGWIQYEKSA